MLATDPPPEAALAALLDEWQVDPIDIEVATLAAIDTEAVPSPNDLVQALAALTAELQALRNEVAELRREVKILRGASKTTPTATNVRGVPLLPYSRDRGLPALLG